MSQSIGYSERIWLLWPPTKQNLELYTRFTGESGLLTKIASELVGGYIACVDSSMVVYLPPGWLHATFTTKPGTLVGINFASLEGLDTMARSVAIHVPYLFRTAQTVLEDISEYRKAVFSFLDDEHEPQLITAVLKSWVLFMDGKPEAALQHSEFRSAILDFLDGLKGRLSGKEASCCGIIFKNVVKHVRRKHWIDIPSTRSSSH